VKAEATRPQAERRLQISGKARRTIWKILRSQPEMLIEDTFETAIDNGPHHLVDGASSRQGRQDHWIVQVRAQALPAQSNEFTIALRIKNGLVMPKQRPAKRHARCANGIVDEIIEFGWREAIDLRRLPPFEDSGPGSAVLTDGTAPGIRRLVCQLRSPFYRSQGLADRPVPPTGFCRVFVDDPLGK
jgi:hypothetical protein